MINVKSFDDKLIFTIESNMDETNEKRLSKFIENFWWLYQSKKNKMIDQPLFYTVLRSMEMILSNEDINDVFKVYTENCISAVSLYSCINDSAFENKMFNYLSDLICSEMYKLQRKYVEELKAK